MKIPSSLIVNFITSEFPGAILTSTNEYHFNSPFDTRDSKKRLYINKDNGKWIDFKEGISGSFLSFVKKYFSFNTEAETIRFLVENYDLKAKSPIQETKEVLDRQKIIREFILNDRPKLFGDGKNLGIFGKAAYDYVLKRKINNEYLPNMGYVFNQNSRFNRRVFIPFFEEGRLVYFITRTIDKKNELRYLTPPFLDSKEFIFNIDKINEDVIICEGVFDAMSIVSDQAATSLLSADIGAKQMEKLFEKRVKNIIYVPDKDETGIKKMDKNIKKIISNCYYDGLKIYVFNVPDGCKDLNDMALKTGKNYILKKECSLYGSDLFIKSAFANNKRFYRKSSF